MFLIYYKLKYALYLKINLIIPFFYTHNGVFTNQFSVHFILICLPCAAINTAC